MNVSGRNAPAERQRAWQSELRNKACLCLVYKKPSLGAKHRVKVQRLEDSILNELEQPCDVKQAEFKEDDQR